MSSAADSEILQELGLWYWNVRQGRPGLASAAAWIITFTALPWLIGGCTGLPADSCFPQLPTLSQGVVGAAHSACDVLPCRCGPLDLIMKLKPVAIRSTAPGEAKRIYEDPSIRSFVATSTQGVFAVPLVEGDYAVFYEDVPRLDGLSSWGRPRAIAELTLGRGRIVSILTVVGDPDNVINMRVEPPNSLPQPLNWP